MKTRLALIIAILLTLAIPLTASAQVTSYTSGFQIQNLDPVNGASVDIVFYNQDGSSAATVNAVPIAAGDSYKAYPLDAVTSGFNGSVVVSSNTQVAAIANVLGNNGQYGASYDGFTAGATTVNIPLVEKDNYGINTWFNIQNTASAGDATVTVTYKPGACTETKTVKPGAAQTFDQAANTCLPNGFVGAATVSSGSVPVAATVMQVIGPSRGLMPGLLAFNGFTTASTNPVMPLVSSGWYGSGTGIQIQNTGSGSSDVTLTFTPSADFPSAGKTVGNTCTQTLSVPGGQSVTFAFGTNALPASCFTNQGSAGSAAFVGSAKVTGNTANANLVAVVNQVTVGKASAEAYGAFDPSQATSKVSFPLIMDRNYGYFTGFAVANVGAQTTNVNCTFNNSSVTVSGSVAAGQSLTNVQLNELGDKYVGSAVCTATGGDPKIVGVANELLAGAPATTGALLVYEGINY